MELGNDSDPAKAVQAKGLFHQIESFSFIISLVTSDRIFFYTKSLSDNLQATQGDLASAADLKETFQLCIL